MAMNQPPPNYGFTDQPPPGGPPMGVPGGAPMPQGNGMAVAGLVLGILALVLFFLTWPSWILAILGIIFGALGISKGNKVGKGKGMATAGLVCAILGLLISIAWTFWIVREATRSHRRFGELQQMQPERASVAPPIYRS
jgi:hypothetical protein